MRGKKQGGFKKLYNGKLGLGIELDFGRTYGLVEIKSCLCFLGCILYPWMVVGEVGVWEDSGWKWRLRWRRARFE